MKSRRQHADGKKRASTRRGRESKSGSPQASASRKKDAGITEDKTFVGAGMLETSSPAFRMESSQRRSTLMAAAIILLGLLSLYWYVGVLTKLRNYYTLIIVIPMYAYVFGDLFNWMWRGIRAVELSAGELRIFRPRTSFPTSIVLTDIDHMYVRRNLDGTNVTLLLQGATARKFLWMDFYSGPRIQISDGVFNKADFQEFVRRLTATRATIQQENR